MRTFVRFLLALACLLFLSITIQAQTGSGGITGKVTDSGGGILQGAQISVEPGGIKVVSDAQGEYLDRKSTRLNSSHGYISYAVFCLKKKKIIIIAILLRFYRHRHE